MVVMIGKAYVWKASGLVAVTHMQSQADCSIRVLCEGRSTCMHWCFS